ncbi:Serine/threonine-protein kinase svkA [Smittium mucronatum]|uniref:non-specific serine/threonine protein kinase n=1 Tax=Smittium mucronatum TaxID=133383 RepID=A0A1R0H5L8_9FUNG|nr:Serine/threonine-protein kinase svkA [Smittium mucronatum]
MTSKIRSNSVLNENFSLTHKRCDVGDRYVKQKLVGRGAYGLVYKGLDTFTGKVVAIKVMNLDKNDENITDIQREISLLSQLDSPFITHYITSFVKSKSLWILMDYAEGGSIHKLMKAGPLQEKYTGAILYNVLRSLDYLNTYGIMHRDIKAANILITKTGQVQLCDFGVARQSAFFEKPDKSYSFVGTPYWMAPEVISEDREYNNKADIWSLGITCFEIVTGNPPLVDHDPKNALSLILKNDPPRLDPKVGSHELQEFVSSCLNPDPLKRPSAKDLLSNKFIKSVLVNLKNIDLTDLIFRYDVWEKQNLEILEKEFDSITDDVDEDDQGSQMWIFDHPSSFGLGDSEETRVSIHKIDSSLIQEPHNNISFDTFTNKSPDSNNSPPEKTNSAWDKEKSSPKASFDHHHSVSKFFCDFFIEPCDNNLIYDQDNSRISYSSQNRDSISENISSIQFCDINRPYRSASVESISDSLEKEPCSIREAISATYSGSDSNDCNNKNSHWRLKEVANDFKKKFMRKKDFDLLKAYQKQKEKQLAIGLKKSISSKIIGRKQEDNLSRFVDYTQNILSAKNKSPPTLNIHTKSYFFKGISSKSKLKRKHDLPKIQTDTDKISFNKENLLSTPTQSMPTLKGLSSIPPNQKSKPDKLIRYASEGISLFGSKHKEKSLNSTSRISKPTEDSKDFVSEIIYDVDSTNSVQSETLSHNRSRSKGAYHASLLSNEGSRYDADLLKLSTKYPSSDKRALNKSTGSAGTHVSSLGSNGDGRHFEPIRINIIHQNQDINLNQQISGDFSNSSIPSPNGMFVPISPLEHRLSVATTETQGSRYFFSSGRCSYISDHNSVYSYKHFKSPFIQHSTLIDFKQINPDSKHESRTMSIFSSTVSAKELGIGSPNPLLNAMVTTNNKTTNFDDSQVPSERFSQTQSKNTKLGFYAKSFRTFGMYSTKNNSFPSHTFCDPTPVSDIKSEIAFVLSSLKAALDSIEKVL